MIFSKKTDHDNTRETQAMIDALGKVQAIVWFDNAGNVLDANENFLNTLGYTLAEIKGKNHRMFMDPAEVDAPGYQEFWNSLGRGEFSKGKYTRRHKDGRPIYIRASYNPMVGADGKVEKVVKFAIDITDQEIGTADLTGQIDAIHKSQAVIEFDLDGNILTANDNFLGAMGYDLAEIKGKHHRLFVEPAYAEGAEYRAFWSNLANGKFEAGEYKRLGKGGREVWIQATYNPIFDPKGKPYKVVKFASDVTKAKLKASESESKINAISRSQAIVEFDLDGTVISANENFLSAMGYQLNEIVGKNHRIFVHPEYADSPAFKEFWRDLANGEIKADMFKRFTKSGDALWIQASYNPVLDPDGKPYKIVKFATDVTPWKTELEIITDALAKLAKGDLTTRLPGTDSKDFSHIRESFNATISNLQDLVTNLMEASTSIETESESIAASAIDLSQRCERQAATVEETSAAMDEISAAVKSNAQNAKGATEAAKSASDFAGKGGQIVEDAIAAMTKIEEGSSKIQKIIEVIDAIAFQTNLLALNAGVEAARAGDAGKGFAVVASEVRALAQRASESARDIGTLIEASGKQVSEGATLVNQTGDALREIVDAVTKVSSGIEDIFVSSTEQSQGIHEIHHAISEIDQTTQSTAAISEESTAAATNLAQRAGGLREMVDFFHIGEQATRRIEKPVARPSQAIEPESAVEKVARPPQASSVTATSGALALDTAPVDGDGWDEF